MFMMDKPPKLPVRCGTCGRDDVPIYLSNYKCKDCMRAYNHERYLARKAGYAAATRSGERWDTVKTMDPTHEWIFVDDHWEEYEPALHGTLVGVKIIEKEFDDTI